MLFVSVVLASGSATVNVLLTAHCFGRRGGRLVREHAADGHHVDRRGVSSDMADGRGTNRKEKGRQGTEAKTLNNTPARALGNSRSSETGACTTPQEGAAQGALEPQLTPRGGCIGIPTHALARRARATTVTAASAASALGLASA